MKNKVQKLVLVIFIIILLEIPVYSIPEERLAYINLTFWEKFEDDYLKNYILCALENNHEAKSAVYKSEQFRQEMKMTLAHQLPSLSVAANYLGIKIPLLDNFEFDKNGFVLPFQFNYEADLLLKNRDKTKSKDRLFKAQKFDEKTAYIMLVSDVATTYINILKFDKTIELQNTLVANREEILKKTQNKYSSGIISQTELNNAKKELNDSKIELEELLKQRLVLLNRLAVLIGESAENTDNFKRCSLDNFAKNVSLTSEISSNSICSRPDIQSMLYKVHSAGIDIKVAKKDFLPTFNITGLYAFNTFGGGNFFSWSSTVAAIIAGATLDLFRGGEKIANLKYRKAKYDELFEMFMQTNLNAIKEVNDALYQSKYDLKIYSQAKERYISEKDNLNLENKRYKSGTTDIISLLEQSCRCSDSQQNYTQKKAQKFTDLVSIYKSVGGAL